MSSSRPRSRRAPFAFAALLLACSDSGSHQPGGPQYLDPGTAVADLRHSASDQATLQSLEAELQPLATLSSDALLAAHAPSYGASLGYDPESATNLPLIQKSSLALNTAELAKLKQQGFVIAPRHAFPNMAYAYRTLYAADLPLYVSLDSILASVHHSYDAILKALEEKYLSGELRTMLNAARMRLADGAISDAQAAQDVDLFLSVTLSLLDDQNAQPVAGARAAEIAKIAAMAKRAEGILSTELFGAVRELDYSQFKPRGHYEDSEALQRYFRASMWLGRTDLRLIETLPNGKQVFRRRQLDAVLALRHVLEGAARTAFDHVDQVVSAFVGEHDYMQLSQVDALIADLGGEEALHKASDQTLAQTIIEKGYGAQRIASQVIFKDPSVAGQTLPLDRSFALLGQRYVADSHVFSNVVYDRVIVKDAPFRYLPDPLDVAYAALRNDAALPLLKPGLDKYGYAPHLARMRTLIDAHGDDYWGANLYNLWISSLRAVSPGAELADPQAAGLPALVGTEAWQRRLLNTQLASWAELRHDTLLYVKQSYTSGAACQFPDGYVDPYPEAFERLRLYALKGQEVGALLPASDAAFSTRVTEYFSELATVSSTLRDMAKAERAGVPFNAEQMAFLNDAVTSMGIGCAGPSLYKGWYSRLLFDKSDEDMDPTIADVHTDPGGDRPPAVLHVGTGLPRLLVVTANTCEGPRAYAGVVSSYHEVVVPSLDRLTDSVWAERAAKAESPAWLKEVLP